MILEFKLNEHNLRTNLKNIKNFNYLSFTESQWQEVAKVLSKGFPKGSSKTLYMVEIEPTKINPIVKMVFKDQDAEPICIKLTPYEVMKADGNNIFKYNRTLTHRWHNILTKRFGESYENAKNKHYGIKTL